MFSRYIRLASSLALVISISMLTELGALASPRIAASSPSVVGTGESRISFDGSPDANGLIFSISEPNKIFEPWVVTVYNDSDDPVYDLKGKVEIEQDGQWYLANMQATTTFIPSKIEPHTFGFALAGTMGGGEDWDDSRFTVTSEVPGSQDQIIDVSIADLEVNPKGAYSGTVMNDTSYSVGTITFKFACINTSGHFTAAWAQVLDLRKLDSGESAPFAFSQLAGNCGKGNTTDIIAAVEALIRN